MKFYSENITNEQIKQLPILQFSGEINVIDMVGQVRDAVDYLSAQEILGFDTETRPSFRKGVSYNVSLLQLATEEECFLFRLNEIGFPDELKALLEDTYVQKIGFDVPSDMRQLHKISDFTPGGFIDLQKIMKEKGYGTVSLRRLTAMVLGRRLSKRQRLSNWNSTFLSDAQRIYAATDAWVTLILYKKIMNLD